MFSFLLIVSQIYELERDASGADSVDFSLDNDIQGAKLWLLVDKADGSKCIRCWNYSKVVGTNAEHPGLCEKCLDAVRG